MQFILKTEIELVSLQFKVVSNHVGLCLCGGVLKMHSAVLLLYG